MKRTIKKKLIMGCKLLINILLIITVSLIINTSCQKGKVLPEPEYEIYTDSRDGEIYNYVKIGCQYWMSENLRFKPDSGNYWAYNYKEADIIAHGYLYDWETANNVCPDGWHLPSKTEWIELATYLGGFDVAGGKMKVEGTSYWNPPNRDATNSSGFSALPSGVYEGHNHFDGMGLVAYFWSSEVSLNIYWLSFNSNGLGKTYHDFSMQTASVRLVKD